MLSSLLEEFAGKVDLIYIDPPFATGADFSYSVEIGETGAEIEKLPSLIEVKAYRDIWRDRFDSYLPWLAPALISLGEALSTDGSIYLHCDATISHPIKMMMDEFLGVGKYRNEVTWKRTPSAQKGSQHGMKGWARNTDSILYYANSPASHLADTMPLVDEDEIKRKFPHVTSDGRRYNTATPVFRSKSLGARPNLCFEWRGFRNPHPSGWRLSKARLEEEYAAGRIVISGGKIERRSFLDDYAGVPIGDLWTESELIMGSVSRERTGYPTQKPEALVERIIRASSKPGGLVLDCFIGSGTTAAVAERLGRRWIGVDIGRFAIQTTRKRLLEIPGCRPFELQNLGKYERQYWQGANGANVSDYVAFILDLYKAQSKLNQFLHIHGFKEGRAVHVGSTDSPVTRAEIDAAVEDCRVNGFTKLDILGWEFEMGLNTQRGDASGVQVQFDEVAVRNFRIPREVLDKRNIDAGGIHFFELSVARAEVVAADHADTRDTVRVLLTDYIPRVDQYMQDKLTEVPTKWSDWIDYWSVDFEYDGEVFINQWQAYRTRRDRSLALESDPHTYATLGAKVIVVKIIDIFGNDTTLRLEHEVAA